MHKTVGQLSSRITGGTLRSLLFFIFFYLYMWLVIDVRFMYHEVGTYPSFPVFFTGWDFFRSFLMVPGGLAEYTDSFLAQFFYYSLSSALVVTVLALLLSLSTEKILKATGVCSMRWFRFVPALAILIIYSQYTHYIFSMVAVLMVLLFVNFYIRMTRSGKFAFLIWLMAGVLLYYLIGGTFLLFALLCVLYEIFFRRQWHLGIIYLVLAICIPYVIGVALCNVSVINAYSDLTPFSWKAPVSQCPLVIAISAHALYFSLALGILLGVFQRFLSGAKFIAPIASWVSSMEMFSWYKNKSILNWCINSLVLIFAVPTKLQLRCR